MALLVFSSQIFQQSHLPGERGLPISQAWWIMGKGLAFWVEIIEISVVIENFQSDSYLESSAILYPV